MIHLAIVIREISSAEGLPPQITMGMGTALKVQMKDDGIWGFGQTVPVYNFMKFPIPANPDRVCAFQEDRDGQLFYVAGGF